jgi:peptide-methionine (R)-S-oxide reductase
MIRLGSAAGLGALAACDGVTFPGLTNGATPSSTPAADGSDQPATSASGFRYEVRRTEAEWRAKLTEDELKILREGGTEPRNSSPLATETRNGTYACKGCDLPTYSSSQKVILPQGWVFFSHSYENAVLTGIDNGQIEAHCRRCGSHLGHILYVQSMIVHCINGSALNFTPIGS